MVEGLRDLCITSQLNALNGFFNDGTRISDKATILSNNDIIGRK